MMNSYECARLKKVKTYCALGGVALIALLSFSSLLHALKTPQEQDANHIHCSCHLDEKAPEGHKRAAITHLFSKHILGKHLLENGEAENAGEGLHLIRQLAENLYSSAQLLSRQYYKKSRFVNQNLNLVL